jgi:hypothetical protein
MKLSLEDIDAQIKKVDYHRHETLTLCIIELQNGFFVVGKSACADAAEYNERLGKEIAFGDAKRQIWMLEGYVLRNKVKDQQLRDDRLRARDAQIHKDEAFRTFWLNRIANPFWNARESQ